jgi:hypothetical protein
MSCSDTESSCSQNITLTRAENDRVCQSTPKKNEQQGSTELNLIKNKTEQRGTKVAASMFFKNFHALVSTVDKSATSMSSDVELSDYWDQEKYLSEHNYEEQIDEASTIRLLNFGDDYRNFIDSLSDGLSDSTARRVKRRNRKTKNVRTEEPESLSEGEFKEVDSIFYKSEEKRIDIKYEFEQFRQHFSFKKNDIEQIEKLKEACINNISFVRLLLDCVKNMENCIEKKNNERIGKVFCRFAQEMETSFHIYRDLYTIGQKIRSVNDRHYVIWLCH